MAALTLRVLTNAGDTTKGLPLTNAEIDQNWINIDAEVATKAPLASPALTGTPTAPTAAVGTNSTQLATTAFVQAEIANDTANLAPLASPSLTGTPTAPTAAVGTNSTQLATTAYVKAEINAELGPAIAEGSQEQAIAMAIALG